MTIIVFVTGEIIDLYFADFSRPSIPYLRGESGQIAFAEAKLIIECRIVYSDILDEKNFLDRDVFERSYANPKIPGEIHTRYYAEIEKVLIP